MGLFDTLDSSIDINAINQQIAQAQQNGGRQQFEKPPAGTYTVMLRTLELGQTKDGRPMVKGSFRILEGQLKGKVLFYNRVVYGTRNDILMINSALTLLHALCAYDATGYVPIQFAGYGDMMARITYIKQCIDIADLKYTIDYDNDRFENVIIKQVHYPQQQTQQ